jgi:hypothetical protein
MELDKYINEIDFLIRGLCMVRGPDWKCPVNLKEDKEYFRQQNEAAVDSWDAVETLLEERGFFSYINEDERFWPHSYRVHMHQFDVEGLTINAESESMALDVAIDHAEEQGWEGCYWETPEDCMKDKGIDKAELDKMFDDGELDYAGNHSYIIPITDIQIEELD